MTINFKGKFHCFSSTAQYRKFLILTTIKLRIHFLFPRNVLEMQVLVLKSNKLQGFVKGPITYNSFIKLQIFEITKNNLRLCLFFWKVVSEKLLSKLSCVCLSLGKLVNGKHFLVKEKFGLVSKKVFSWKIWAENTF